LAELPQIEVTGTVDDVRPWYRSAIVVVVPLRTGSGTRLKILEAMAADVPVVSTRLGAEGLDVTDGVDIVLAETALATTDSVDELVRSPDRRGAIAAAARELVRNHYDWPILGARLFEVHHSVKRSSGSDTAGD
jgi:glycosyltransferase involved in cell wall biosynthesis